MLLLGLLSPFSLIPLTMLMLFSAAALAAVKALLIVNDPAAVTAPPILLDGEGMHEMFTKGDDLFELILLDVLDDCGGGVVVLAMRLLVAAPAVVAVVLTFPSEEAAVIVSEEEEDDEPFV